LVVSGENIGRATETQTVEQIWSAESSELPMSPSETEAVSWSYLITGSELSSATESQIVQQPFSVILIETPNGAIEFSIAYRPSQVIGGAATISIVDRRKISLSTVDREKLTLEMLDRRSISLTLTKPRGV
jgi:hypothetical protein